MISTIEDPAVSMARRALQRNNPVYHKPFYNEDLHYVPTTVCFSCGKQMMIRGSHIRAIDGKKRHICINCHKEGNK